MSSADHCILQALDWLHHHYWYPTLVSLTNDTEAQVKAAAPKASAQRLASSSKKPSSNPTADRASLRGCLQDYVAVRLDIAKDRSLLGPQKSFSEQLCRKVVKLALALDEARALSSMHVLENVLPRESDRTSYSDLVEILTEEYFLAQSSFECVSRCALAAGSNIDACRQKPTSRLTALVPFYREAHSFGTLGLASLSASASSEFAQATWQLLLSNALAALPSLGHSLSNHLVNQLCPSEPHAHSKGLASTRPTLRTKTDKDTAALLLLVTNEQERLDRLAADRRSMFNRDAEERTADGEEEDLAAHVARRCLVRPSKQCVPGSMCTSTVLLNVVDPSHLHCTYCGFCAARCASLN